MNPSFLRFQKKYQRLQEKFQKLISFLLALEPDPKKNIAILVNKCGELLEADACMYNQINGDFICTVEGWKLPPQFKKIDKAEGHICYDLITKAIPNKPLVVKDLNRSPYYKTDPNVKIYGLKTYAGFPVSFGGKIGGSLCVVYRRNLKPSTEDLQVLELIATFIGIEEEQKLLNDKLNKKIQFEKLVSSLATRFINLPFDQIDIMINQALGEIGEFCEVDRSYIFLGYDKGRKVRNTHEWCAKGIKPSIDRLKELRVKDYEWFANKIKNKEIVYIQQVSQIPEEAQSLKRLLQSHQVVSLLCVPLIYEGRVMGFLGFDAVKKPKVWSDTDIATLKVAGEMFSYVLMQKKTHQKIMRDNRKLKEFSLKDPLTGLYNQKYYREVIEREFLRAKRHGLSLSILMLDIDYFKSINELYGFDFGDLILVRLAKKIRQLVRKYDIVIRYSGEEFVVIACGIDRTQSINLAQRILEKINLYKFLIQNETVKIKLSIAVVSYPEDMIINSKQFVDLAERLLLKAKEKGGNLVVSCLDEQEKSRNFYLKRDYLEKVSNLKYNIERLAKKTNQSLMESIYAFAKTIEAKDQYTGEHVERTVYYAVETAKRLSLPQQEIEYIREAAILHDLGKVGISEKILCKKDRLTPSEFLQIKRHPHIAVEILRPVHFLNPILPIILSHHERWDGKGYPHGLKREEIPLGARILAVADVFQALISERPYRKAYPFSEAVEIIKRGRASQFDPQVVDAFLEILK